MNNPDQQKNEMKGLLVVLCQGVGGERAGEKAGGLRRESVCVLLSAGSVQESPTSAALRPPPTPGEDCGGLAHLAGVFMEKVQCVRFPERS